ncbi:hypothetical protein HUJ04_011719, partial [Dendroctonus ponderosae]
PAVVGTHGIHNSLKLKSKELQVEKSCLQTTYKTFSISNRLQRKRKVTNGQDELVQKKCKLIDFQMECMRNEEEKNRKT